MTPNWPNKTVFVGDNLHVMRGMNSESVDLIYLDPPFNSNRNYAAPVGSKAAEAAFKDTWTLDDVDVIEHDVFRDRARGLYTVIATARETHSKGMFSYLLMMAVRLLEMHRLLKSTGSLYLHCDPTANAYLRMLLDAVFGHVNFQNEIVWCYRGGGVPKAAFSRKHDTIYRYGKTAAVTFNVDAVRIEYSPESSDRLKYKAKAFRGARTYDNYEPNPKGKHPEDWWPMQPIMPSSKERIGYPTQKPLKLLDRIIGASSNPGDVVFDPFCGCATTMVSADSAGRRWVGCDLSQKAVDLVVWRIKEAKGLWKDITARETMPRRTDKGDELSTAGKREYKATLYGKNGGRCEGCGMHYMPVILEMDHIIPTSKGGTDHADNFQLLCGPCNKLKRDRSHADLLAELSAKPGLSLV